MSDGSKDYKPPFSDPEFARRAGKKGGAALAAKHRRKGIALDQLGKLDTANDCKRWLQIVARGALAGDLDKQDADVAIRALRVWLDAHGASVATEQLEELRGEIRELRAGIGRAA